MGQLIMNKTGLCTIAFRERELEDVLLLASNAGFDAIELWGKRPHDPEDEKEACKVKEKAADMGLDIGVYGSYLRAGDLQDENEVASVFSKAAVLGAPLIRVWAGNKSALEADDSDWNKCLEDFRTLCRYAESEGVNLAVEMHEDSLADTAAGAKKIVESIDSPCLGLNYQPLADMQTDEQERLKEVVQYVVNVHAQNWTKSSGQRRQSLIGEGFFDYKCIYRILRDAGFHGYMEVEFVRGDGSEAKERALKQDFVYLRELVNKV